MATPLLQPVILPGFQHRPGVHCGSTALCDALRARGLELSEPLAFGLGAGLGFHYVVAPEFTPSHFLQGRSPGLERTACEVLGAPAVERTAVGPEEALEGVAEVEGEVPALAALGLAARMEGLADGWTRLAGSLRELGEAAAHAVPPGVLARVRALAEGERRFFEDVGAALAWNRLTDPGGRDRARGPRGPPAAAAPRARRSAGGARQSRGRPRA